MSKKLLTEGHMDGRHAPYYNMTLWVYKNCTFQLNNKFKLIFTNCTSIVLLQVILHGCNLKKFVKAIIHRKHVASCDKTKSYIHMRQVLGLNDLDSAFLCL